MSQWRTNRRTGKRFLTVSVGGRRIPMKDNPWERCEVCRFDDRVENGVCVCDEFCGSGYCQANAGRDAVYNYLQLTYGPPMIIEDDDE